MVVEIKKAFRLIYDIINYFSEKFTDHAVSAYASQASLFTIISMFPFMMLLMSVTKLLPFSDEELFEFSRSFFPESFSEFFSSVMDDLPSFSSEAIISIAAVAALWSASKGVYSIVSGLNSVYDVKETRSYIKTRLLALFYTFSFILIIIALLVVLVFGNSVFEWLVNVFPNLARAAFVIISLRFAVSLTLLAVFFTFLYKFLPNRRTKLLYELPGATVAAIGWIAFSYLYSLYADYAAAGSSIYGSLTTVVFLILWLYFCMYIVFFGAELNALISNNNLFEKYREEKMRQKQNNKKSA